VGSALADLLLVAHAAFVLFVVLGGVLVVRWPRAAWAHLPAAAWGAIVELAGWVCPLTPWELRLRSGALPGDSDFVERLLEPLVYPGWLTRDWQIAMGAGVIVLNAVVYGVAIARRRR
jgi:hypothetical protein